MMYLQIIYHTWQNIGEYVHNETLMVINWRITKTVTPEEEKWQIWRIVNHS